MKAGKPAKKRKKAEKTDKSTALIRSNKAARPGVVKPLTAKADLKALRKRAEALGTKIKRSKLLHAGLQALSELGDEAFSVVLAAFSTRKKKSGDKAPKPAPHTGKKRLKKR